ncbi:hypothetical protein H5410_002381 [Solanum commersonii]|uniref:Uncharacterized protein n=2 Tax=Mesangiospermae TaxID=1437183 RepID=A0A9J6B1W6_SOLCO|nr:hypothetical protein H5410_002381 [Solanum commersonii]
MDWSYLSNNGIWVMTDSIFTLFWGHNHYVGEMVEWFKTQHWNSYVLRTDACCFLVYLDNRFNNEKKDQFFGILHFFKQNEKTSNQADSRNKHNSNTDLIDTYRILWKVIFDESCMYNLDGDLSYLSRSTLQYGVKKPKKLS